MKIKIGISNRHIHLSSEDLGLLFGDNYKLNSKRKLTQNNDYAAVESVQILNGDKIIENIRIVGPTREKTQLEILKTDADYLGIDPPVRDSGDLDDACKITIKGPLGTIVRNATIIANRHIHMNSYDATKFEVKNKDIVKVKINDLILEDVHIKISEGYNLEMHIDVDDAKKYNITNEDSAEILKN